MIRYQSTRIRILGEETTCPQSSLMAFPHCGIEGWGAAIAVGVGAAAGVAGGVMSADAQRHAANQAADAQKNANDLNYQMFQQAHGSAGSAVLPTYLNGPNGGLFEPQLGADLVKAYGDTNVPLSTFQGATGKLAPAQGGSVRFANDLFNGGVTRSMLQTAAPVEAARLATARSSSLDALHKTLDEIDAQQSSRGFVGDSYSNRLLGFQAGKAAGDSIGQSNVANLQEQADIKNYGNVTLPLQNITLPYTLAQTVGQNQFLPQDEYLQSIGQRMQPFNMLKIGYTGPFQYQPLPTPGPGAYSGAANVLGSLSGVGGGIGSAAMQYYMAQQNQAFQQNMLNQITQQNTDIGSGVPYQAGSPVTSTDMAGNPYLYNAATGGGGSSTLFDGSGAAADTSFAGMG